MYRVRPMCQRGSGVLRNKNVRSLGVARGKIIQLLSNTFLAARGELSVSPARCSYMLLLQAFTLDVKAYSCVLNLNVTVYFSFPLIAYSSQILDNW